jgi:hypothetical protein
MRLAQFDMPTDIADGEADGVALDIDQSRPTEGFDRLHGGVSG